MRVKTMIILIEKGIFFMLVMKKQIGLIILAC